MPEHNDMALCKHCGGRITYIEETANAGGGHYEVLNALNAWWVHSGPWSRDGHEGEPAEISERIREAAARESSWDTTPAASPAVRMPFAPPRPVPEH